MNDTVEASEQLLIKFPEVVRWKFDERDQRYSREFQHLRQIE